MKHRHHHRRQKSHTTKSIQLYPLVTFYLKYPALPHLSISNLPIQLYPIYPSLPHKCNYSTNVQLYVTAVSKRNIQIYPTYQILLRLSNLISIIPFYPAICTLTYPTHSVQLIPLCPTIPKNTNGNKTRTPSSTTSTECTDWIGNGDDGIHSSRYIPFIPLNHNHPAIPKQYYSTPSNMKIRTKVYKPEPKNEYPHQLQRLVELIIVIMVMMETLVFL